MILTGIAFFLLPSFALGEEVEDTASVLESRIDSLRMEAKYAEALEVAKELFALKRSDKEAKEYEIGDVERLVQTLEYIAGLSEIEQQELAETDRLTSAYTEHYENGNYTEAAALAQKQLEIRRKLLGDEHPDVASSLNNLASFLNAKGDYAGAEPFYREALAMRRKLLGDEHPDVAGSLNNLANLLEAKGDYAGAEQLYREALAMHRKLLGEEHPSVATGLNNLAILLQAKGDYTGAETLYRESLAMRRKLFCD